MGSSTDGHSKQRVYIAPAERLVVVRVRENANGWDESALVNSVLRALNRSAPRQCRRSFRAAQLLLLRYGIELRCSRTGVEEPFQDPDLIRCGRVWKSSSGPDTCMQARV
jgi:hypothetical protein